MTHDGLVPLPYCDFLAVMESLSVTEACGEPAEAAEELGCKVLVRHTMGAGMCPATVRVEGPDATIYPPEIRHVLRQLGMAVRGFVEAAKEVLGDKAR